MFIKNAWYIAAWSHQITSSPLARTICNEPVVLYRQHTANLVGAPRSMARRAVAAMQRGSSVFMNVLRQHVAALVAQPELMSPTTRAQVMAIHQALNGNKLRRLAVLRMPGLRRQTWPETMLFRLWFLLG